MKELPHNSPDGSPKAIKRTREIPRSKKVSTDHPLQTKDIHAPVQRDFPMFAEHIRKNHTEKSARYEKIAEEITHAYDDLGDEIAADLLIYPASGGDAFPILSADTLIMIDPSPFASVGYEYEEVIKHINDHPERAHSLEDLLAESEITDAAQKATNSTIQAAFTKLHVYDNIGFVFHSLPETADQILKNLFILGVSLPTVTIQNIGENKYRISCDLDGKEKNIYYIEGSLRRAAEEKHQETPFIDDIQRIAQDHGADRIAVLSKADMYDVSKSVIDEINPDVLIFDNTDTVSYAYNDKRETYAFSSFTDSMWCREEYGVRFGYGESPRDIILGKRKSNEH